MNSYQPWILQVAFVCIANFEISTCHNEGTLPGSRKNLRISRHKEGLDKFPRCRTGYLSLNPLAVSYERSNPVRRLRAFGRCSVFSMSFHLETLLNFYHKMISISTKTLGPRTMGYETEAIMGRNTSSFFTKLSSVLHLFLEQSYLW